MSGDAFKRARKGARLEISAAGWNACLDAAEAHRQGQAHGRDPRVSQYRQADIVLVKNDSGADVARFGVLGIDGVIFTPSDSLDTFQNQVALRGSTPFGVHAGKFVVCLDPIPNAGIGRAWVSGVCQVKVDVATHTDRYCDVKPSDRTKLQSAQSGSARILYMDGIGTGERWCVVRIGDGDDGATTRLGKTTSAWNKGTLATIAIYEGGTPPSETQNTGDSATLSDCVNKFANVASGKWVMVAKAGNGRWYLISAEC